MSNRNWTGFSLSALGAAVAIVAAAPAMAQNTTAAINGRITATDGKAVAGATVTIVHRESGSTNTLTTDAEGRYSARGLRVGGPYDITITKGADKEARSGIFLALAENLSLDLRLGSQQLQTVTITGSSAASKFNSGTMGAGTSIGRNELDAYASINRNLQDYARTDPRLSQTDKERGEISAAGQNVRYNSVTIDGVTINDTFGLEANNMPTAKQPISIDAIQSVQVNISNYDVTQKGYTGANINAVTKSGTNELKGSVYYVYRNDKLVGQRYNRAAGNYFNFLPFKEDTKGFTLGGPIVKDKLFFFASYEELKSTRAQPEFGPVGSQLTTVPISQSSLDSLKNIAKTKYNMDVGDSIGPSPLTVKDSLVKLDWNISDQHRANVRFARTEQDETNFGSFSASAINLTSWWWNQKKKIDTVIGQVFSDWTPNFSTEVKISNRDYHSEPQNNSKLPAMALQFSGAVPAGSPAGASTGNRFVNFGTELSRHYNILDTKTVDAYFGANWVIDDHELKFGADYQNNKVFNAFFQNTNGNYTFNCNNGWAYSTIPGIAPGTVLPTSGANSCAGMTSAQVEAAVLENFSLGRPINYQVQTPVPGGTLEDGIAKWSLAQTGLFLQDTWSVNDKLTITAGVRLDQLSTGDKPAYNAAAGAALVAGSVVGTTVTRNSGGFGLDNSATVDGKSLVQPRFGFNYLLSSKKDDKAQVRGGFGLFQGAAANVWLSNPYSNTGLATRIIGCGISGFSSCPNTGGLFNPDPSKQTTSFTGTQPAANVDFVQSGLGQPSVWKLNLAYDGQLPFGGLEWSAEWLYTKTESGIYYKHLNLGAATKIGPDGREMYFRPEGYNPACFTATGGNNTTGACATPSGQTRTRALSNPLFNNVLQAVESNKGGGNSITLAVSKPARLGFGWQVAYTRSAATEVSPLTSSVSNSNFNSRAIFNPNEDSTGNSAALIKDRVSAAVNWSKAFIGNYKTTVGLFYEGRKGKPYSWTYRNDMNGDGTINDLMYIPSAVGSGEVEFLGDTATNKANETNFWNIVNSYKELRDSKGGVVKRFGSLSPWVNSFDLRISQQIPGFSDKHKGTFSFDILNVGNLINPRWGRINEVGFASAGGNKRTFVNYVGLNAAGKYIYQVNTNIDDLTLKQVKGESQWAVQATARYEF
ncbi:TonB-dependent receptor [Roseateles microcysteis]|uniref:TonB-dependent receptor n=1 Tax=Roseateles microcysteis TaxID=3119057 RepID=UPI002FE55403